MTETQTQLLCSIEQREWLFENCDWAGGYLYAR